MLLGPELQRELFCDCIYLEVVAESMDRLHKNSLVVSTDCSVDHHINAKKSTVVFISTGSRDDIQSK